jgi:hypothetical protein
VAGYKREMNNKAPKPGPFAPLTRRHLLSCGLALSSLAAPASSLAAEEVKSGWKVSQEAANYIDKGPLGGGTQICANCHYFIDPYECLVIEGYVSPQGWCDFYND